MLQDIRYAFRMLLKETGLHPRGGAHTRIGHRR